MASEASSASAVARNSAPRHGLEIDARRSAQVKQLLSYVATKLDKEKLLSQGKCLRCAFFDPSTCVCDELQPLPCKHKVTVMLHPAELGSQSSTHNIMKLTLQNAEVCVWNSPDFPTGTSIWDHVTRDSVETGRAPVILFPSADAMTVPELLHSMTASERAAGIHVVVLEGTWANAKSMIKDIPPGARRVVIQPTRVNTLFSPLRTQPAPGKVSTIEAVACLFDEIRLALRTTDKFSGETRSTEAICASRSFQ
jgi:DTW domain-containing protein YfiP